VLAYELARRLSHTPDPLLAPLTALLVAQITIVETVKSGLERVGSVVAGVLVAVLLVSAAQGAWNYPVPAPWSRLQPAVFRLCSVSPRWDGSGSDSQWLLSLPGRSQRFSKSVTSRSTSCARIRAQVASSIRRRRRSSSTRVRLCLRGFLIGTTPKSPQRRMEDLFIWTSGRYG
jgi:hypothetical protein